MGYWDDTDLYLRESGGKGPACPKCGKEMFAADDHGRFTCFCSFGTLDTRTGSFAMPRPIPQVDVSGMTDAEKARVPPFQRLHAPPTAAEAEFFRLMARGPEAMDDPEYWKAGEAVDNERKQDGEA